MGHAIGDFGILQEVDDDAEEAEHAAGSDESAGIERAGAGFAFVFLLGGGFYERANEASSEHRAGGGYGEIGAGGEGQRPDAENLDGDHQSDSHQHKVPRETLIENSIDDGGHQAGLRSGSFVAADALRPLVFNFGCGGVVQVLAVGNYVRAQRIDERVVLALIGERVAFDFYAGRQGLDVNGNLGRQITFEAFVHQVQRGTDGDGGNGDANQQAHLLPEGRGANEVAGLQVL